MSLRILLLSIGLCCTHAVLASELEAESTPGTTFQIPYQLTQTNHHLVRVRINGKGPFNLLVDTGAPALYISTQTARKLGLKAPADGYWNLIEHFEIEGGPSLDKLQARVEDPYQLIGMNALGLPGASIDGILGFTALARFKMLFDPTQEQMTWTLLDYRPKDLPAPPRDKNLAVPPELQLMSAFGPLAKLTALLLGKQPEEKVQLKGLLGVSVREEKEVVFVENVLPGSAAARAGFHPGDKLVQIGGKSILSLASARGALLSDTTEDSILVKIRRGPGIMTLKVSLGEGF